NGLPDWFEIFFFGSLGQDPNSDPDGDGYSLAQEYALGLHPLIWEPKPQDEYVEGGIAQAHSSIITMNLNLALIYQLVSSPAGFVAITNTVTNGTVVVTTNLGGQVLSGYRFAYWDLDGVRQQDNLGIALGSFSFTVENDTVATAHYFPETRDSDTNG